MARGPREVWPPRGRRRCSVAVRPPTASREAPCSNEAMGGFPWPHARRSIAVRPCVRPLAAACRRPCYVGWRTK